MLAGNLAAIATGLDANRDEVDALVLAVLKRFSVFLEFGLCGCVTFDGCSACNIGSLYGRYDVDIKSGRACTGPKIDINVGWFLLRSKEEMLGFLDGLSTTSAEILA